jgi:predicted ATPase
VIVSLKFENRDIVFDLSQESEGFRRFFAHLIALHQVPPKSLVTFEEPEKGLYPGALAALADQIKAFPMKSGGQVILTTHSPLLLDHFEPEQIRVVDMENLQTKIGRVSQPQMEALHEQLETTGELLTVDPAQLASGAAT